MFRGLFEGWHLVLVLLVVLLVFGANRLPGAARNLAQSLKIFKRELESDDRTPTTGAAAPTSTPPVPPAGPATPPAAAPGPAAPGPATPPSAPDAPPPATGGTPTQA